MYDENIQLKELKSRKKKEKEQKEVITENENEKTEKKATYSFQLNYQSVLKKIGILVLVVFAFIFITTKIAQNSADKVLEKNLDTIKNGAYKYFKENNRPSEKDEEYTITLQDLIDDSFVSPIKDKKGKVCNAKQSEITISKKTSTKYNLVANLECNNNSLAKEYTLTYSSNSTASSNNSLVYYKLQKEVVTNNYQYSCPTGYVLDGKSCYSKSSTITATPIAQYKTTSSRTVKASYKKVDDTYEYVEPVEITTPETYSCPSNSTLVGNKCMVTKDYKTTYTCSSFYPKKSGSRCYYTDSATQAWTNWTYIAEQTFSSKKTSTSTKKYELLRTYKENGKTKYVYAYSTRVKEYVCPTSNNETVELKGKKCYHYVNATVTKTCATGYSLNADGSQCVKYTDADKIASKTTYVCPTGYEQKGTGENMQCYKKITHEGFYYCKSDGYSLVGDQCVREASTQLVGYKCPTGYNLSGNQCVKTLSGNKVSATKTNDPEINVTYKWSTKKSESGWVWTGETKELDTINS